MTKTISGTFEGTIFRERLNANDGWRSIVWNFEFGIWNIWYSDVGSRYRTWG